MRLLLVVLAVTAAAAAQHQQHQQQYNHRTSPVPTPFYQQSQNRSPAQSATVSRHYPSTAQAHSQQPVVSAYHTSAAGVPAAPAVITQHRLRNPYPTQTSYRAPQRKATPRAQSNHVPILTKAAPTRIVATVAPAERARLQQQLQHQQLHAEQERRRMDELQRKNAEKLRLDQERRRQSDEKKRSEQERKHRQAVEAAERQRVEQARIKAEEERKRAEEENKKRTDEELRRKSAENERIRQHHAAAAAAATTTAQREQPIQKHTVAPLQSVHHTVQPLQQHQNHHTTVVQQLQHTQHGQQHQQAHPIHMTDPRNHYNSVPLVAPVLASQQAYNACDMPPDLWCDSREAAAACGVEQQCARLRRKPIKITLIYEALCPFCQRFISNQLGIVFNTLRGHFELEMVPWGNARLLPDGSFSCNHGQKECDANRLQSCVLDQLQVQGALPFIVCFEKNIFSQSVEASWRACTAFVRSKEREIRQCYDTEKGVQLQRIAAQKTFSAAPQPIVEVPYLLINDYSPTTENNDLNVMLFPQLLGKWAKIYNRK